MFSSAVMCGKRLNCWKTMPMSARSRGRSTSGIVHVEPVDDQPAGLDLLEPVDAADQRALAGAARAADHEDLAPRPRLGDALEHLQRAEALVHVLEEDRRVAGRVPAGVSRSPRRAPQERRAGAGAGAQRHRPPHPPSGGGLHGPPAAAGSSNTKSGGPGCCARSSRRVTPVSTRMVDHPAGCPAGCPSAARRP